MRASIEKVVAEVRESTGAPSISLAIVKDAKVALAQTYGDAVTVHEKRNRAIVEGLQHGKFDRAQLTTNCRSYFTSAALKDFAAGLHPLGEPKAIKLTCQRQRGGLVTRVYDVEFPGDKKLEIVERTQADGKIESWIISPGG